MATPSKPLPFGFDRADGTSSLPSQTNGLPGGTAGTASPAGSVISSGKVANFAGFPYYAEEEPDSPEIERAEQATAMHRFRMAWNSAVSFLSVLGRGTFVTDSAGNRWRILSSKIQSQRGGMATLSVTSEALSFDSPPDEFQIVPIELGVDILKHPRYAWALLPYTTDNSLAITTIGGVTIYGNQIKEAVVRMIQAYRDSPIYPSASYVQGTVQALVLQQFQTASTKGIDVVIPNPNGFVPKNNAAPKGGIVWDGSAGTISTLSKDYEFVTVKVFSDNTFFATLIAAAREMLYKLWRNEDTPPVTGYEITWAQYYFAPTYLNPGNYIENPVGIVPYYFMSPTQTGNATIFDELTAWNPQCFATNGIKYGPLNLSCLRKPDEIDYQRTWFKVTRKWLCSPIGHWDQDLLTGNNRPQNASGFNYTGQ